jgi:hypothetical protein
MPGQYCQTTSDTFGLICNAKHQAVLIRQGTPLIPVPEPVGSCR